MIGSRGYGYFNVTLMIFDVKDEGQFLYHYTKSRTAIDYILKDRSLRLSAIRGTNDPKEVKDWEFSLGTNQPDGLRGSRFLELSSEFSSALKDQTRVLCFSMDEGPLSGGHIQDVSLRGFARPRMWAQYAEDHNGVCLVFDKKKLKEDFFKLQHSENSALLIDGPVVYRNRTHLFYPTKNPFIIDCDLYESRGLKATLGDHVQRFYKELFFEKMTDWSAEREFRFILFTSFEGDVFLDISKSIRGVIVGESVAASEVKSILAHLRGVEVMRLDWINGSPWYDFGNPING